ncbi:heparinase II/III-family protein [Telluria mixta]|uniref:Heparinase II/III-family protein n=1 Tax=Telluria mixta TaxID=34071 RepID=A0ABT2C116_9BURK|nr:heparinase II/III-family protein [Telluria mixta]MCS0631078.1 heparinase II/III-family protein [Telluria mixta]WEM95621.1 heparinase II/III-family protein [Telluria mixta]
MNRRNALTRGLGALALLGTPGLRAAAGPAGEQGSAAPAPRVPKRYLRSVVDEALLRRRLLPPGAWHPYPRAGDRTAWAQVPADVAAALIARADAWLGTEWPQLPASLFLEFAENGNRTHYEQRYFERRSRLAGLVLAECVQGQGRYVHAIADGVWLVCEETFWGLPAHSGMQKRGVGLPDAGEPVIDLFAAETGVTLAYVHELVGDQLRAVSPLLPVRIAAEVKRRILDPGLARDDFKWMGLKDKKEPLNNWTSWIASSWLEANLLLETDPARRIASTLKICGCLDGFLADYSDDGACEEGPGYWTLSAGPYLDSLMALDSATGGALNLATDPFVRRMGHYVLDVHVAGDWYVNYGDAHAKVHHSPPLLHRFGRATGDADLAAFGAFRASARGVNLSDQGRLARDVADVLEVARMRATPGRDALQRASWYPALGLMTARAQGGSDRGFFLAVQAASNARSHGHHDSGSFIVFHDGQPVFVDPGVEAYTAKTFSKDRYTIWTMQSGWHNLPLVDGRMQVGRDARDRASRVRVDDMGMTMDLSTAYGPEAGIRTWERRIALDRAAGKVNLRETFALARPAPVALVFVTPRKPDAAQAGVVSLPVAGGRAVHLRFDPRALRADVERLPLEDAGLKHEWGDVLYRIRLASAQPLGTGDLAISIAT